MPSFGDTALIALLALLLFGPKKLPELARQLGKLMGEFRRASNEFRMQMEDELRVSEQADRQKQIAAMEAAAPVAPALSASGTMEEVPAAENSIAPPAETAPTDAAAEAAMPERHTSSPEPQTEPDLKTEPLPIASAGDLHMMPPSTGLPAARTHATSPLAPVLDAIPHTPDPETADEPQPTTHQGSHEASLHG